MKHGDRDSLHLEIGKWFDSVPMELNEMLHEHCPGPANRVFRTDIRKAYWLCTMAHDDPRLGAGVDVCSVAFWGPHQEAVVTAVNGMIRTWRVLHKSGFNGAVGLEMSRTELKK